VAGKGWMVSLWQKFSTTKIQVNLCPHPSFPRNQNKIHLNLLLLYSLLPPGFHSFFTLAILCRAAKLGHTLFTARMAVDFTSIHNLTFLAYFRGRNDNDL